MLPSAITKQLPVPDSESQRFVMRLGAGWNLGDTFDGFHVPPRANPLDDEQAWNGARTTPEMFDRLKDMGFTSIRLPVSWHGHVHPVTHQIDQAWLDRVAEVLEWMMTRGFHVILNIHHDNSPSDLYPSNACLSQSMRYMADIWSQLAQRFAGYDEQLLFNSWNEPRLTGHPNEWKLDSAVPECVEAVQCINRLNQVMVDTVRAAGGHNARRYLLVPGYAASADGALHPDFAVPRDPVTANDRRILVSVHAYTPYPFALEQDSVTHWSHEREEDVRAMVGFMDGLYERFVSRGQPVLLDEFGARSKDNLPDRVDFTRCYVTAARNRGMPCFWWDNNAFEGRGELFGLLDRKTLAWRFEEIAKTVVDASR